MLAENLEEWITFFAQRHSLWRWNAVGPRISVAVQRLDSFVQVHVFLEHTQQTQRLTFCFGPCVLLSVLTGLLSFVSLFCEPALQSCLPCRELFHFPVWLFYDTRLLQLVSRFTVFFSCSHAKLFAFNRSSFASGVQRCQTGCQLLGHNGGPRHGSLASFLQFFHVLVWVFTSSRRRQAAAAVGSS